MVLLLLPSGATNATSGRVAGNWIYGKAFDLLDNGTYRFLTLESKGDIFEGVFGLQFVANVSWAMDGYRCWHPETHNAIMVVAAILHFVVKAVEKIQDHFGLAATAVIQQAVGECRTYARDDVRTLVMNAYPEYFRDF